MRAIPRQYWLVGMLSLLVVLTACEPEQAPASAARTAAALRTPAAASTALTPGTSAATVRGTTQPNGGPPQTLEPAGRPAAKATPQAGPASLKASPNSVQLQSGQMGTTTISWDTGQSDSGEVYVSENSEPEKLFSSGATGSQDAPWIKPDHTYVFRLYAGSAHNEMLASVTLGNASPQAATDPTPSPAAVADLKAEPNPVPADDEELGTATVTWNTAAGGAIYVSQDDGPEQLFASGVRGTEAANWICRGSTYEFRLYAGSARTDPLKTVVVTRADDAPDHEPPPVVECKGPPDQ